MLAGSPAFAQQQGNTSYTALPFVAQIYRPCWMCTAGLDPKQLFADANPNSPFVDAALMAKVRANVAAMAAKGTVPTAGLQRWEDTYEASFPAGTFPGEPESIAANRAAGHFPTQKEFVAWRNFISGHPQYADVAFDGGTMPNQPEYYRSWGAEWGYISPLTPLDAADCPPENPSVCTWGDLFAHLWSQVTVKTGAWGLQLSDFTDGQPYQSTLHNYNPRITAAFAATGPAVPPGSPAVQSAWIEAHAYSAWTDFLNTGYARFYQAMLSDTASASGHAPLMVGQCSISPAFKRTEGVDARIFARVLNPDQFLCIWDDQVIQVGRSGPLAQPPAGELAGYVLAAAREPLVRNGATLEADDSAYWSAIAQFYPTLSASDQQAVGTGLLKRLYVWSAWAQIVDRSGNPRRALAFLSRDYWDAGSITRLGKVAGLIHSVVPAHPFGPALYYSVAMERTTETQQAAALPPGGVPATYLLPPVLQEILDGGAPIGTYVSDAALPAMTAANAPSAWLVPDVTNPYPKQELDQLQALAPVVTSVAALQALPNQPLVLPSGAAGFGFLDAANTLYVVVSNPTTAADAAGLSGTVKAALAAGKYAVTELQSGTQQVVTSTGTLVWSVSLDRWDTLIYKMQKL